VTVHLNHTIVSARDPHASAHWLAELFDLDAPRRFGPFWVVDTANGVSLDFVDDDRPIEPIHYAFLVGEDDFDRIFGRILDRGIEHWADPARQEPSAINHHDGGRGVYFPSPDGHFLEIITRPYGSGSA
jgi:hypothetical protein